MLKPSEIQEKEFKKIARGYDDKEVDTFLDEVFIDYDLLYRENVELKDRLGALNKNMDYYRNMEHTLQKRRCFGQRSWKRKRCSGERRFFRTRKPAYRG